MRYKELTITVLETLDSLLQKQDLHRALRIIMDFREILEIDGGEVPPGQTELGLGLLIGQVVESLRPAAGEKEVTLAAFVPPADLVVCGDWDHTRRALTDILRSLIYAVPVRSGVFLRIREAAREITVEIQSNDRIGAIRKVHQAMDGFDSFGGHSDPYGDVVLGLFLAKALVELHGGTTGLASGGPSGDSLFLTLPRLQAAPGSASLVRSAPGDHAS
jgi:signal transduction histidine kinase